MADIDYVVDITNRQKGGLQNWDGDGLIVGADSQSEAVVRDFVLPSTAVCLQNVSQ